MNKPFETGSVSGEDIRYVDIIREDCLPVIKRFYLELKGTDQSFYLMDQIRDLWEDFLENDDAVDASQRSAITKLFRGCQEVVLFAEYMYALLRPKIGVKRIVRLHPEREQFEEVSRGHYLEVKDAFVQGWETASRPGLVLNFQPYFTNFPKIKEPTEMGEGISFLNRQLSGQMYRDTDVFRRALVRFLQDCQLDGVNLLANDHLNSPETLADEIDAARSKLADMPRERPYAEIAHELRIHGFEAGWGGSAGEIAENLALLSRVFQSPDPGRFETFLGRLPLVKSILMVSPHGYFAQEGVLGRPDTGGQVTYVLDQARALERRMRHMFEANGIDIQPRIVILTRLIPEAEGTTCNVPREKVHGSENCWILRVPFRDTSGEVVPHWISRFQIWPYLETFAEEARNLVVTELLGKPDLVVGHYSDGNLVAYMLAEALGVTHCAAVHALEKTKYLFSDMRWAEMEEGYRFSLHFSADIIAYNSADYIITSSYREIAGTHDEMGMFESYETFSMPGLFRVLSGMDPQLARYNIVPPGASEEYFFPYAEHHRRVESVKEKLEHLLFGGGDQPNVIGHFEQPEKPPIFAMSRLDKVKNLAGFVELFGKSESLRETSNLIILSSIIDASQSKDQEEIDQINRIHELMNHYQLHGQMRWVAARLDKVETGEVYRIIADHGGVFAQPALMETFGLTVIEAMSCGLPVVVTCFGGPAEIVVPGQSGAVENPNDHEAFAAALEEVLRDRTVWDARSTGGVARVQEAFNWSVHARNILRLANVYSYWNYLDVMNRQALDTYIHTLYHTVFRPRAQAMIGG